MSIKMVLEIRHPHGEPDLYCPQVFCDWCGERITEAGQGNFLWRWGSADDAIYHVHKRCTHTFETHHQLPDSETWLANKLRLLPVQLEANLAIDHEQAVADALNAY